MYPQRAKFQIIFPLPALNTCKWLAVEWTTFLFVQIRILHIDCIRRSVTTFTSLMCQSIPLQKLTAFNCPSFIPKERKGNEIAFTNEADASMINSL
ncbi:hypothetical protein BS78_K071000 [Paspalum vaginatum]|uniref:Uncharacterized protein n=1 Tax=Paspalum vaginatum TaxID=158149 RepID=A0A9W8CFY2_9POAL|nr:hypothetical protein BS78_K071000 [Paspalum vaginatum]